MDEISNEVEIKKEARKQDQIDKLKKQGKTVEEINALLPKEKKKEDVVLCKTATDVQKRKLDRLMKDVVSNKESDILVFGAQQFYSKKQCKDHCVHILIMLKI